MDNGKKYVTKKQLAEHLQVSLRTITNLQQIRAIPCIKLGKIVRFDLVDVTDTLKENYQIKHIRY